MFKKQLSMSENYYNIGKPPHASGYVQAAGLSISQCIGARPTHTRKHPATFKRFWKQAVSVVIMVAIVELVLWPSIYI